MTIYGGLFLSAFLSATLLPGSSEAALVALLALGEGSPMALGAVATAGNVLGSLATWALGRVGARWRDRRWFPVGPVQYDRAVAWYARFGLWTLLFAWVPVVGDPLTLAAGALRAPLGPVLVLVTLGKAARYAFVIAAFQAWAAA